MGPGAPTSPSVTVVVPVHRGGPAFARCLESLLDCRPPPDRLIVVVDGPDDGETALAVASGAEVLHTGDEPRGPAAARNLGAWHASTELLFFVDADVVVHADVVARARARLGDARVDAVIGSYDDSPGDPGFLSQYKNLAHHFVHQQARRRASTFWGACGVIRREVFWSVGGFDEGYGQPSIEDIELGVRLRARGAQLRLDPGLQVRHLKRWTPVGLLRTEVRQRALPWSELILSSGSMPDDLNVDRASRAGVIAAWSLVLLAGGWTVRPPAGRRARLATTTAVGVASGLLAVLDWPLFAFLARRRGWVFALRAEPWQLLARLYSGGAFAFALVRHVLRRWASSSQHRAERETADAT